MPGDSRASGVHFAIPAPRSPERVAKEGSPLWLGACRESDLCEGGDAHLVSGRTATATATGNGTGFASGAHSAANAQQRAAARVSTVIELDALAPREWSGAKERRRGCGQSALHRCAAVLIAFALLLAGVCFSLLAFHFLLRTHLDASAALAAPPVTPPPAAFRAAPATPSPSPSELRAHVVISLYSGPEEVGVAVPSERPVHAAPTQRQHAPNAQPLGDSPAPSGSALSLSLSLPRLLLSSLSPLPYERWATQYTYCTRTIQLGLSSTKAYYVETGASAS